MNKNKHILSAAWKVGTSSSLFHGLKEKDLEACRAAGVACVEVCVMGKWFDSLQADKEAYCRKLAEKGQALGIEFWSTHLPFGHAWDISVPAEEERKEIVRRQEERMAYAAIFKVKKAVVHASCEPIPDKEREARLAACRKSLAQLSEKAGLLGIQLAVECLPRTCIGNSTQEVNRLVEGIDRLGVCCDTNHLLADRTEDFIRSLGPRIVTLHVSDYDRVDERHWMPGRGVNDWNAVIGALESIGYDGPVMFEVRQAAENPIRPADLKECWDRLLGNYQNLQYMTNE